ncbi:MAG: serine/threonine-protein kinase [Candidatus Porifericomitaceae bacterium WSBS_2022_MAG_OTU9]
MSATPTNKNSGEASSGKQARIQRIAEDLRRLRDIHSTRAASVQDVSAETLPGTPAAAAHLNRGKVMDYRVVRLVGEGAMSRVYLAKRVSDGTPLVLKIMDTRRRQDDVLVKRFIREAEMIAELRSRYVVRIYDNGFTNNYGFIAMEYFPRGDLRQRIKLGIPLQYALRYIDNLAHGLAAIHSVGVVHRDLKPANLMFRADDTLALADFGISKRVDEDGEEEQLTMVGQVLGTPYYMSPEQGQGLPVDVRSDLYSMGVIIFELLAGERPFRARTPSGIIYQHIHADVPRLEPQLGPFQLLLNRLLAKTPENRYGSALEFLENFDDVVRSAHIKGNRNNKAGGKSRLPT